MKLSLAAFVIALGACGGTSNVDIPGEASDPTQPSPDAPTTTSPSGSATAVDPNAPIDPNQPTTPVPGPWPGSQLVTIPFAAQKNPAVTTCGQALADITSHLHPTYGTQYDVTSDCISWGQVNTLGVDNFLSIYWNPYTQNGIDAVGFYVMKNRAAFVVQPTTTKLADVGATLPAVLRGPSYSTRLVDPLKDWNDQPSYILDELAIELNGAEVAMDLSTRPSLPPREAMLGSVETALYVLALGQAVYAKDAAYVKAQPQFRELVAYQVERAMTFAKAAVPTYASTTQDGLISAFRTNPSAKDLRNWARIAFGNDYATQVLGIGGVIE